ncbi:MAG: hypothetical protein HFH89_05325 [Lachnospiraceae bacterium]|nr:hypothetical protein [uncultured Acetatifactor sp.]MCI8287071.1 hypothetical protein [Lachnospiraceae bacterium]
MDFTFDGKISKPVLENYLSRAVTAAGLYESDTLEDDLRVLQKIGAKFLGRASGVWYMEEPDEEHFEKSRLLAERVHEMDPEIILQACIFEMVVERMEEVEIPLHVLQAFGQKEERRHFRLEDTLFPGEPKDFRHHREGKDKNGGIPDLSRTEAAMWFYYRATRYIDCGYEALHMGQVHLYTANDPGMAKTVELFDKIRKYAAAHGRRHKILMDAHTHGVNIRGKLLFDYHAMPFTRVALLEEEGQKLVLVREGFSEGGVNPDGWSAESMPYLMEYDNWGGRVVADPEKLTRQELAARDWWGYDQIAWFANQPEEERNRFLEYTYRWTEITNVNAYFEVPFRRMLSDAWIETDRADNGSRDIQHFYQCNRKSPSCPMGFSQEDTICRIWGQGHSLREKAGNPPMVADHGAREVYDEKTGYKLPERVVVYGSFQPYAGAVRDDSNSEVTRMYYVGNNTYVLSVVIPFPGEYDFGVSTYGTLSATYSTDRFARSGSGHRGVFRTEKENAVVRFTYEFMSSRGVKVEVFND